MRRLVPPVLVFSSLFAASSAGAVRLAEGQQDASWGPAYLDLIGYLQPRLELVDDDTRCPSAAPCESEERIVENAYGGGGFGVRRARVGFAGRVHELLAFQVLAELAGSPSLMDAYLDLPFDDTLQLRFGQFKTPFGRQLLVPESRLQMIEPSVLVDGGIADRNPSNLGAPGRDIGLMMTNAFGDGRLVELHNGVFNGDGRNLRHNPDDGVLFVSRLSLHPLGAPGRLEESDVAQEEDPRVSFALNLAIGRDGGEGIRGFDEDGDPISPPFAEHTNRYGADLAFFWGGFSLYGELLYRVFTREGDRVATGDEVGFGYAIQGGYLLPIEDFERNVEIAGRFDFYDPARCPNSDCDPDELAPPADPMDPKLGRSTVTAGVNFFFTGDHTWKLQANYVWAMETEIPEVTDGGHVADDAFLLQMTAHL
jgi:hypothetical protein